MEIQHHLYKSEQKNPYDYGKNQINSLIHFIFIDLCLPAICMPFGSGNIINSRAYQFFHSVGK